MDDAHGRPAAELPPAGDPEATAMRRRNVRSHQAILRATRDLVEEIGYARLTIEGIAATAGVGKSTIYRWWRSKGELVVEAMAEVLAARPIPDTGNTRRDLLAVVHDAMALYGDGSGVRVIMAGLVGDMSHDPELAGALRRQIIAPRRAAGCEAIERAFARGDLPAGADVELVMDMLVAPVAYRALITAAPVTDEVALAIVDGVLGSTPGDGT